MTDIASLMVKDATPSKWEGAHCSESSPGEHLIKDNAAWQALWKKSFGQEAPTVNFSKYIAAVVFVGTRNTGGYGVDFLPPREEDEAIILPYTLSTPSGFVIQAFTQPYGIQLYHTPPKPAILRPQQKK